MKQKALQLLPYDPQHICPACGAEGNPPRYHQGPLLIVFGKAPEWSCSGQDMQGRVGEHLCNRCESCSYTWMEAISPGMDGPPA